MKKIVTPLVGPKGRKDILLRLEKLEERVAVLENAPTNEDEQEVVVEDEFTPIKIATNCYIKSTDAVTFGDDVIGTHVYSNESCTTPAANGEYSFSATELEDYSEEEAVEIGLPAIISFVVEDGVITDAADAPVPEEPIVPEEPPLEAILLGTLSTNSSKKAYVDASISEEELEGEKAYSDDTLSEYAVAGHYIGNGGLAIVGFDVDANGTIRDLESEVLIEEPPLGNEEEE